MADVEYKILFEGKLLSGFEGEAVKADFGRLFQADDARVARLFSGKAYAIRKDLTEKEARKFEQAIARIGGQCRIVSTDGSSRLPPAYKENDDELFADGRSAKAIKTSLNFMGRIGRVRFLALSWLVVFIEIAAVLLPGYIPMLIGGALTIQETLSMVIGVHLLAVMLMMYLTITRLHDMDRTGWLWPFLLIPVANLLFMFWLSFAPGSKEQNTYGNPPPAAGNLTRAIGVYLPVSLMLLTVAAGYLHQDEMLALIQGFPEQLLKWTELEYRG